MNTAEQVRILSKITTHDKTGKHFTEIYAVPDLAELEAEGLIAISRPTPEATGIPYSQEHWTVKATEDGLALVEAYPEYREWTTGGRLPIRFAVVQSGYYVFGVGFTRNEAFMNATKWMVDERGNIGGLSPEAVKNMIVQTEGHVKGDLILLSADHADFDSYLEEQGGFEQIDGVWYASRN